MMLSVLPACTGPCEDDTDNGKVYNAQIDLSESTVPAGGIKHPSH